MASIGQRIDSSSFVALQNIANGKGELSFANSIFGGGSLGGTWQYGNVAISSTGSGYLPGDIIGGLAQPNVVYSYGNSFEVASVNSTGGILGIRTLQNGVFITSSGNPVSPTSPQSFTGGSGTSASANFTCNGLPAKQNYQFFNWDITNGIMTGLYSVNGGENYNINDTLYLNDIYGFAEPLNLTVNSTGSNGSISSWTVNNTGYFGTTLFMPSTIGMMSASYQIMGSGSIGSGSGAFFGGYYNMNGKPVWTNELWRMMNDVGTYLGSADENGVGNYLVTAPYQTSGGTLGWPVASPSANFNNTYFWFTGSAAQNLKIIQPSSTPGTGNPLPSDLTWTNEWIVTTTTNEYTGQQYGQYFNLSDMSPPYPTGSSDPGWANGFQRNAAGINWINGSVNFTDQYGQEWIQYYGLPTFSNNQTTISTIAVDGCIGNNAAFELVIGGISGSLSGSVPLFVSGTIVIYGYFSEDYYKQTIDETFYTSTGSYNVTSSTVISNSVYLPGLVSVGGNMPGSLSQTMAGSTAMIYTWTINQMLSPGRYTAIFTTSPVTQPSVVNIGNYGGSTQADGTSYPYVAGVYSTTNFTSTQTTTNPAFFNICTDAPPYNGSINHASMNLASYIEYSTEIPAIGICSTGNVYKIQLPGDSNGVQESVCARIVAPSGSWNSYPSASSFYPELVQPESDNIYTSCAGLWTANTAPIINLNVPALSLMPWNIGLHYNPNGNYHSGTFVANPMLNGDLNSAVISNGYNQSLPRETQLEPMGWASNRYFPTGATIYTNSGSWQSCIRAGISNVSPPNFPNTTGSYYSGSLHTGSAIVTDGTITWQCVKCVIPVTTYVFNKTYNVGDTCIDGNGNTQTCVSNWKANTLYNNYHSGGIITDYNNNLQIALNSGTSSMTPPSWAMSVSSSTIDNQISWSCFQLDAGEAGLGNPPGYYPSWQSKLNGITVGNQDYWQLTTPMHNYPIAGQAPHRLNAFPRYPAIWTSETNPYFKLPTTAGQKTSFGSYEQWYGHTYQNSSGTTVHEAGFNTNNLAYGWWIYSISVNRIGNNFWSGSILLPTLSGSSGLTQQISVDIGCMRSGAYTSFGSFMTGQTYQVLWPVFTSDPIYYQCSERVDIQALPIAYNTQVGTGITTIATFAPPVLASYINDCNSLLNLIN